MIFTFLPALAPLADTRAARRSSASVVTCVLIPPRTPITQLTGDDAAAHAVTSFPPIDTVMSPICPGWALMNASAACTWVWPMATGPAWVAAGGAYPLGLKVGLGFPQ